MIHAVAEGEVRVGAKRRSGGFIAGVVRLVNREVRRVPARHLAGSESYGSAVPHEHYGIRLDARDRLPGEREVVALAIGRCPVGNDSPVSVGDGLRCAVLHQETAAHTLEVVRAARPGRGSFEHAKILLLAEYAEG